MKGVSGKEWNVLSHHIKPSPELVERYGSFLAQLIANRGFEEEHEALFDLKLKHLLPYSFLPNVEEGVERIVKAVRKGERIILFGDYDVDGITGTAILFEILKSAGAKVIPVLPNRGTGYGLSGELVSLFSKYGELLITIDNGTSAVREIEASGIDVIVIDHHNVPEEIPKRAILINPKMDDGIPKDMRELSSSAICFYIAAVLTRRLGIDRDVRELLDLVALGTVGDVMPMNRTNRILVTKGISVLEGVVSGSIDKPGVRALLDVSGVRSKVSAKDIAYSIAPRINAPGRIGNPKLSLYLLTERDEERAKLFARKIEALNSKRRAITEAVFREAYRRTLELKERSFISLWDPSWHVGVLGIVAGRLSNLLGRPVAVFSKGSNHSVGSVRSVEGVDVYKGLSRLSHMFIKWGGHTQAAGLTLRSDLLEDFRESAEEIFSEIGKEIPPLDVDMELSPRRFDKKMVEALRKLEPYGERNPVPTFLSEEMRIEDVRIRGSMARLRLGDVEMICWEKTLFAHLKPGRRSRIVYSFVDGEFNLIDIEDGDGSR